MAENQQGTRREFMREAAAGIGLAAIAGVGVGVGVGGAGCATSGAAGSGRADRSASRRHADGAPNIVVILSDDHRYDLMGCVGGGYCNIKTPHMDRLAAGGVVFENAMVTSSLCSPSRASMLTGLYAHLHQVLDNDTEIPAGLKTYPMVLRDAGYTTAYIGKWHMGYRNDKPRPGFDHWASFVGQGQYADQTFNINGRSGVKKSGYTTDAITGLALEWLRGREPRSGKPFCMIVGHKAPHEPFTPPERYRGAYDHVPLPAPMADADANYRTLPKWVRAQRKSWHGVDGMYDGRISWERFCRDYPGAIAAVDDSVGAIVGELERQGLLNNTLVVYLSDNGFQLGEHGLIDKRTAYEGSIRIPMIAHWPGRGGRGGGVDHPSEGLTPGLRVQRMVLNIDLPCLLLDAAGVEIPAAWQGRSPLPLARGKKIEWRRSFLYEYFHESAFPQTPTVHAVRTEQHKYIRAWGVWDKDELYDLHADAAEMNNLAADPRFKQTVTAVREELATLMKSTGSRSRPTWQGEYKPLGLCEDPFASP